jgi:hypothetical protein
MTDKWLTTAEVKAYCGITAVPYSAFGIEFPTPTKDGRKNLYSQADLDAWMAARQNAIEGRKRARPRAHRRANVCADCGQPWPCPEAVPVDLRCRAKTGFHGRCRNEGHTGFDGYCGLHRERAWDNWPGDFKKSDAAHRGMNRGEK